MFKYFESRLPPYPPAEPHLPPKDFMAFVWDGTRGLRGYVVAMAALSAAIAVFEALLFAVLGLATAWSPLEAKAALREWIGWRQFLWLFVALALFETRRSKKLFAALLGVAAIVAAGVAVAAIWASVSYTNRRASMSTPSALRVWSTATMASKASPTIKGSNLNLKGWEG